MKYYGIKSPEQEYPIWWITNSYNGSWRSFFQYPNKDGDFNAHRAPIADAIRAYEAIGYKCVELEVREKR